MKKIILGVLGVVAAVGIAGGAAFALLSDTVSVSGLSLAAGNADLQIEHSNGGNYNVGLTGLFPGEGWSNGIKVAQPTFSNVSLSPIDLDLTMRLTTASGDWDVLKHAVEVYVKRLDNAGTPTGWITLNQLNSGEVALPGPLTKGDTEYEVYIRVPYQYQDHYSANGYDYIVGNEIAGKSITNVTIVVTGTQHQ